MEQREESPSSLGLSRRLRLSERNAMLASAFPSVSKVSEANMADKDDKRPMPKHRPFCLRLRLSESRAMLA